MSRMKRDTSDSSSECEDVPNEDGENESQSSLSDLEDSSEDTTSFGLQVFEIQSFICANNIKLCSYSHFQGSDLFALVLGYVPSKLFTLKKGLYVDNRVRYV